MATVDFNLLKENIEELPWSGNQEDLVTSLITWLRNNVPHYNWVGIYWVEGHDLVLGPWDGPGATEHLRIPVERGICGLSAQEGETVTVPDVRVDPRYIACFFNTRSEIVVPIMKQGDTIGVLDIDSDLLDAFQEADRNFLEWIAARIGENHQRFN